MSGKASTLPSIISVVILKCGNILSIMLDVRVHWYLLKINQYKWFVIIDVCAWCWNTSKEEPTFVLLPTHWIESTREGHVCVRNSLGYQDFHLMWLFGLGKIMQWPVRKLLFILIRKLASLCNGMMCHYILPAVISVVCWAVVPSMRACLVLTHGNSILDWRRDKKTNMEERVY